MVDYKVEERYLAFIKNSSEGIWLCEVRYPIPTHLPAEKQVELMFEYGYMAEANEAMAKMYALDKPEKLIGMRVDQLLVKEDPKNVEFLTAFVKSGYKLLGVESHERDIKGRDRIFRNSLVGVVENGVLMRAWGTQQDITDQYFAAKSLLESEERLAQALNVSGMGIWEWDMIKNTLTWSDQLKKLYGLNISEKITYEKYRKLVHESDRPKMDKLVKHALKNGREYRVEHRIKWKDGSIHWVMGTGKAIFSGKKPVRMIGTSMSIDDMKRKDELEEINKKLEQQRDELEKLNQSKDEFISLASHQLRTPATAVKQYLHMLLDGYQGEITKEQKEALVIASESNERQLTVINDLLKVAQLDAGKVAIRPEQTDLLKLIKEVISELSGNLKLRKHKVSVASNDQKPIIKVDKHKLRMVFENLIDNADKYSSEGKEINIKIIARKKSVTVRIIDEGVGISKEGMAKLFQKFSRLDNSFTRSTDGTGLGLYWANKIVMLHGGTIEIESIPKKGSTFIITLPIK